MGLPAQDELLPRSPQFLLRILFSEVRSLTRAPSTQSAARW